MNILNFLVTFLSLTTNTALYYYQGSWKNLRKVNEWKTFGLLRRGKRKIATKVPNTVHRVYYRVFVINWKFLVAYNFTILTENVCHTVPKWIDVWLFYLIFFKSSLSFSQFLKSNILVTRRNTSWLISSPNHVHNNEIDNIQRWIINFITTLKMQCYGRFIKWKLWATEFSNYIWHTLCKVGKFCIKRTRSANPVHVALHFPFQLLFLFGMKKSGPALHSIFFFGKLAIHSSRK